MADPYDKIEPVQGRRCWGVRLVCGIQLNAASRRHECEQAGRCIFAPQEPPAPADVSGVPASGEGDPLESPDFYEVCQQYRHAQDIVARPGQLTAVQAFEALKAWLRTNGVMASHESKEKP